MTGRRIFGRVAEIQPEPTETESTAAEPDDLAAAAARCHENAARARELASERQATARSLITSAEEQAARIVATAQAEALTILAEATGAERREAGQTARGRQLDAAAAEATRAREADQRAADLAAEREVLAGQLASLDQKLDHLNAERQATELELGQARELADVNAITVARARLDGIADLTATLASQRTKAQSRTEQIGDGSDDFPGDLSDARKTASGHHGTLRGMLNELYPDRPEAAQDAAMDELQGALAGIRARLADEARGPAPRTVIMR